MTRTTIDRAARDGLAPPSLLRHRESVMGTVFCFDVAARHGEKDHDFEQARADACMLLHEIDDTFSLWKADSLLSRYRRGEPAQDRAELDQVIAMCKFAHRYSSGWFDAEATPGGFDPTGLVKGWAGEVALAIFNAHGYDDAMVNAAGDIATSGSADGSGSWRIGIQHPGSRSHLMGIVAVDGAIATSGCYERGVHLYDPRAERYAAGFASATVVGPRLWLADALATALAVAGTAGFEFIDALDGYEAIAMTFEGSTQRSAGWSFVD